MRACRLIACACLSCNPAVSVQTKVWCTHTRSSPCFVRNSLFAGRTHKFEVVLGVYQFSVQSYWYMWLRSPLITSRTRLLSRRTKSARAAPCAVASFVTWSIALPLGDDMITHFKSENVRQLFARTEPAGIEREGDEFV